MITARSWLPAVGTHSQIYSYKSLAGNLFLGYNAVEIPHKPRFKIFSYTPLSFVLYVWGEKNGEII